MYIKSKEVKEDKIIFESSPAYNTHKLINKARAFVDDYMTFINYETLLEIHNFRKYCIEPLFEQYDIKKRLYGVKVSELLYFDMPFTVDFLKNGKIIVYFPSWIADDERKVNAEKEREDFIDRIERNLKYVSVS